MTTEDGFSCERARMAYYAKLHDMRRLDEKTASGRTTWRKWWREMFGEYEAEVRRRLQG